MPRLSINTRVKTAAPLECVSYGQTISLPFKEGWHCLGLVFFYLYHFSIKRIVKNKNKSNGQQETPEQEIQNI